MLLATLVHEVWYVRQWSAWVLYNSDLAHSIVPYSGRGKQGIPVPIPWSGTVMPLLIGLNNLETSDRVVFLSMCWCSASCCSCVSISMVVLSPWSQVEALVLWKQNLGRRERLGESDWVPHCIQCLGQAWVNPTLAWLHCTRVYVYIAICLFGPTTYRKFEASVFKHFMKFKFPFHMQWRARVKDYSLSLYKMLWNKHTRSWYFESILVLITWQSTFHLVWKLQQGYNFFYLYAVFTACS